MSIPWTAPVACTVSVKLYAVLNSVNGSGDGAQLAPNVTIPERTGPVTPSVQIAASKNPACAGDQVTFTATATSAGANPAYAWTVNGAAVGSNSATFTTTTLTNGATVKCNHTPAGGTAVVSNTLNMTVTAALPTPVVTETGATLSTNAAGTCQWYSGATDVSGATQTSYTATANGSYSVQVSSGGCTATSAPVSVTLAGLNQLAEDAGIRLYPSPNNGVFTIESPSADEATLTITDLSGRVMHSQSLVAGSQEIRTSGLSAQMYIATVTVNSTLYNIPFLIK